MNLAQTVLDLPSSVQWLTPGASSLADYQGRPLAIVFASLSSAWCRQRLVDMERWQKRNPGRINVLVVVVPRFGFERSSSRCLTMVRQCGSTADVALDLRCDAWMSLSIIQWPTVVLLDLAGRETGRLVGANSPMEPALAQLCEGIPAARVPYVLPHVPKGLLHPRGVAVTSDRIFIADTGNHRILACTLEGRILRTYGNGVADLIDGPGEDAAFHRPHALAVDRQTLYVADTGNHAIRRINLVNGQVDTLIGNGRQSLVVEGPLAQPAASSLSQPAGVALFDNKLLFSQMGDNRIWSYDLGRRYLERLAGSGALDFRDGGALLSAFAQPEALLAVQRVLYVCDALASAIRTVQLPSGAVQTSVGKGMWDFGHADGERQSALLQFPQALAMEEGSPWLWIADAGNGVLRRLRLGGGELSTVPLPRALPGIAGLAAANGKVWISDTDGNGLLRYDPVTGDLADIPIGE